MVDPNPPDGVEVSFSLTCADSPTEAGSFYIQYTIESLKEAYDNGAGSITGPNITAGSINYDTGVLSLTFDTAPDNGTDIVVEYQKNNVSWAGNTATVKLADALLNGYASVNTVVGMCLSLGDLEPTKSRFSENLQSGSFDENEIILANKGTIEQRWTLSFTDGVSYTCVGDIVGSKGAGNTSDEFAPNNPDQNSPYLKIPAACWATVVAVAGNTVVIDTHPSSYGIWWRERVPVGTVAYSNNITLLELYVE